MEESLEVLFALLPDARRVFCEQDLNRFVSERRKMEWLSVRVLLYAMLQEVTPPALIAAIPVGASTIIRFGLSALSFRRKVVLPVPALPVKKR